MGDSLLNRVTKCPVCGMKVRERAFTVKGADILRCKNYNLSDTERVWLAATTFPVLHCSSCGLYFHEYIPTESLSDSLYNRWIPLDSSLAKLQNNPFGHLNSLSYLLDIYGHYVNQKLSFHERSLLEVGCGWGKFMEMAQSFGLQSTGIEYTIDKLVHVRKKGMTAYLPEELPPEAMFDIVAMIQVLEHLPAPLDFIRKYTSKVKPGGLFILEVPNCNYLSFRRIIYRIAGREIFGAYQPLEHVNCFTSRSLDHLMAQFGFSRLKHSQKSIVTRLGTFCFRRPLAGIVTKILLGSTELVYVRDNER